MPPPVRCTVPDAGDDVVDGGPQMFPQRVGRGLVQLLQLALEFFAAFLEPRFFIVTFCSDNYQQKDFSKYLYRPVY